MKRVYSAQDTLMVDHLKHVLDAEGIGCEVRNRQLSSAMGRVPPAECWTELWILDDARLPRAQEIVEHALRKIDAPGGEPWTCPQCGERLEPQFDACWKCSTPRQGAIVEEPAHPGLAPARRRPLSSQAQLWVVCGLMALVGWYLFRSYVRSPW